MSPITILNQDDDTDPEIGEDESEDTGQFTVSSDIEEDDLDHQQEVLPLGQVRQDMSL